MAEDQDDIEYEDDEDENGGFFRWLQMVVVLFALGGFFGLAWYAYKSGDVVDEKDVELIKTEKSPVKEAPADPGGMHIPNQDKTVYGLINGNKTEKPPVERILPPTEEPIQHSSETETWVNDKIKNKNSVNGEAKAKQFSASGNAPFIKEVAPGAAAEKKEQPAQPQAKAKAAPITAVESVATQDAPEIAQNAEQPAAEGKQTPVKTAPTKRPAPATEAPAQEEEQEAPKAEAAPVAPQKLPKVRIQLGAFKSEQEAKQEWAKIIKKFSDDLNGKQSYIVHVVVKGKNFYRLQAAPFGSPKAADEVCMTLVSANQGCFLAKDK